MRAITISKLLLPCFLVVTSVVFSSYALAKPQTNTTLIKSVVDAFKHNDKVRLSKLVSYPLLRQEPVPAIRNEAEFIQRFDEVFDSQLINAIVRSDIHKDWNSVGWRGIMLHDGDVWLDHDGNILSVNYQTKAEQRLKNAIAAKGRRSLHRSAANYQESVIAWETKRFHIRVDQLENQGLRYTAWSKNKKLSDKPDIQLLNGKLVNDGNGRNQRYVFENGNFSYQLKVNHSADTNNAGFLEVFKGRKRFVREIATDVRP